MSARGGLAWGHVDRDPVYQAAVSSWHTVILNESNWTRQLVQNLKAVGVQRVGISFGRSVFVDAHGAPSVYWPVQRRIHALASDYEGAGWVKDAAGQIIETTASPRAWLYNLTKPRFRRLLSEIIANWIIAERPEIVMFDELHTSLVGIPGGDALIDPQEWTRCAGHLLRQIAARITAACIPVPPIGTNGTFRVDHAPGVIRWHYWQNIDMASFWRVQKDREAHPDTEIMLHTAGAEMAPLAATMASQIGATCYDWHPAKALPFDRVYPIPTEVTT